MKISKKNELLRNRRNNITVKEIKKRTNNMKIAKEKDIHSEK